MKILTVTNCSLDPTLGSGKTVLKYSQGLRDKGHKVDVLAPQDYIIVPALGAARRWRQALGAWRQIKRKMQEEDFDIIEFYGAEFWPTIIDLKQLSTRPLLIAHTNGLELLHMETEMRYKVHGSSFTSALRTRLSHAVHRPLMRLTFAMSDKFVSLCEQDRQYVVKNGFYSFEDTSVVEPGLDDEFLSVSDPFKQDRDNVVAFTGSWTKRKGIDRLVSVMSALMPNEPTLRLAIYGSHADVDRVLADFAPALQERITVHRSLPTEKLVLELLKAKIFFFPAQYEGYGMALGEALACGCAALCTPTGLGRELKNNEEALVCDYEDSEAMIRGLKQLLADDQLRFKLAKSGFARTGAQGWQPKINQLETVYKTWLAQYKRNS